MSEQQSGLRFDIYERVHLPEEVAAIRELDEVELTPQIRVEVEGDQAVVKGSLLLTGSYSGQAQGNERGSQSLEHTIPVEITLPMSRINSVEAISVDIDNFDVDLLTERSLNVTGVLSLHGIEMVTGDAAETWRDEEEVVFVHESAQPDAAKTLAAIESAAVEESAAPTAADTEDDRSAAASSNNPVREPEQEAVQETAEPQTRRDQLPDDTYDDYEALQQYDEEIQASAPPAAEEGDIWSQEAQPADAPVSEEPEKSGMKIAFGAKKDEGDPSFDLKTYVGKTDEYRSAGRASRGHYRNEPAPEPEAPPPAAETIEWKSLFLSANEERQFKKVRLCIVHKDETLESIALRYDRKPQEIRLYNGLSDQDVTEGQVIFIP